MPNEHACECAICQRALATPVDEMIFLKTVVPLAVPSDHIDPNGEDPGTPKGLPDAIAHAVERELPATARPNVDTLLSSISISAPDPNAPMTKELLAAVQAAAAQHAKSVGEDFAQQQRRDAFEQLPGSSIAKARTPAAALRRLADDVRARFNVLIPGVAKPAEPRSAARLDAFDTLRIMFFERIRCRGGGYTFELAPFHEVSVVPGGTVSLSHQSFAQRQLSQEDIFSSEETHESSITSAIASGGFGISLQDGTLKCATANAPQVKAANPFNCGFDVTVYYSPGSASGGGARGSALVYYYDRSTTDQFQAVSNGVRVGYECQVTFF